MWSAKNDRYNKKLTPAHCGDTDREAGMVDKSEPDALAPALRVAAAALLPLVSSCGGGGGAEGASLDAPAVSTSDAFETPASAARFLTQATFGPNKAAIDQATASSTSAWFLAELDKPATTYVDKVLALGTNQYAIDGRISDQLIWDAMITANDQLRQRMMFALSQILVISFDDFALRRAPLWCSTYMDALSSNALGNYRDLLEDVTYTIAMAQYLTYFRNRKANPQYGSVPDENYAREIMQLFTIGLVELNPDGTPRLQNGQQIETYTNADVTGLARVFTGLSFNGPDFGTGHPNADWSPLIFHAAYYETGEKTFLGRTIPANTPGPQSLSMALDILIDHPNTAPFVSRQLIQRFITSTPTPDYVRRVATAFDTGRLTLPSGQAVGAGRRGDLAATLAAILFDVEARDPARAARPEFGKIREPVLRFVQWARAFNVSPVQSKNEQMLEDTRSPTRLGQQAFRAPSVFNFYRPGYVAPGTATGAAALTAPELQIVNETSIAGYINFMSVYIRNEPRFQLSPTHSSARRFDQTLLTFSPNYTTELALASDPPALVDHLNSLLTYGRLEAETRNRIISVLNEIPISSSTAQQNRRERVEVAIVMMVSSPEYIVQR
jgi:uncharacterized protein (DUF1800 family)